MDKQEISKYTRLSKYCAISIDKQLLGEYPGIVREVWIKRNNRVQIRFADKYVEETDEAAVDFYFDYDTENDLIHALEIFIQKPLDCWINWTTIELEFPPVNSLETSWMKLKTDFINKKLTFPSGWINFVLDPYWKALLDGELTVNSSYEEIRTWVIKQSRQQ